MTAMQLSQLSFSVGVVYMDIEKYCSGVGRILEVLILASLSFLSHTVQAWGGKSKELLIIVINV